MNIVFCYQGRYHIRDAIIIEYCAALSKKYGHTVNLVYDEDTFGVTDNVVVSPVLRAWSLRGASIVTKIMAHDLDMVVFLDGFIRKEWNSYLARQLKEYVPAPTVVELFYADDGKTMPIGCDYCVVGEPEYAYEHFLRERLFEQEKGVYAVPGQADLNALPLPDKALFAPYVPFRDSYLIYTSKGCPYRCSYCEETIYAGYYGAEYFRRRLPENVIHELLEARRCFGISEIIYKDSVFTWDRAWLEAYLPLYKEKIGLPYKCFGKAEMFDEVLAKMLKDSGCYCIEFGAQTFNEELKQTVLAREETNVILSQAFEICDEHKLRYDIDHLFGIPGESVEDHCRAAKLYASLKYLNRVKCHNLTVYPQAPIAKHLSQNSSDHEVCARDFFSSVAGEKNMRRHNAVFQKYYKVLPLLPRGLNRFLMQNERWNIFLYIPSVVISIMMFMLAIKNGDKRFMIYLRYYPRKITRALMKK